MDADPDAALSLLADLHGATDEELRGLAQRLAGRIMVDLARQGASARRGVGRLRRRSLSERGGDLDLDASLDAVVAARMGGTSPDPDSIVVADWERPDTAVCLLVDRSGSMHGERLAAAALAAATVVLRAPQHCSVVAFAEDAIVLRPQGGDRGAQDVVTDLLRLRGFGVTDVGLALRTAASQLSRSAAGRRLTVLLSDCRATTGGEFVDDAAGLDELVVLAPEGDSDDAERFADALGARWAAVGGPTSVVDALTEVLAP